MPEGKTTADDLARTSSSSAELRERSPALPPGVSLPGIAQMLASLWWMDRFEAYLLRGPAIRTLKIPGLGNVVTVRDPAALKKLFTANPEVAGAAEINARLLRGLGPGSIMLLDGDRHLRMRRLLLPPFHGEAVEAYAELIQDIALEEIETWPEGRELAVHPPMQRIALEAILRAVAGVSDARRAERLRAVLPKVLELNPIALIAEGRFPRLGRGMLGRLQPWARARREARELIRAEIAAHRASPQRHEDVLGLLIAACDEDGEGLSDDELEDQLLTLLLAGHETTASTLAFCFERLVRHPKVLRRLTREVRDGDDAYLEAVIDETQRVRPVVEVTWRILFAPMELGGYVLPRGTIVAPAIRGTQLSEVFEDAGRFRPERFLEGKPDPYTLIPFGGGTRRCLGASFARLEMKTVLRTVLERFELEPTGRPAERRNRVRRFTTVPARGARVVVRSRSAPAPNTSSEHRELPPSRSR